MVYSWFHTLTEPALTFPYLFFNVCILEYQTQGSDVLLAHTLAASQFNSMFDTHVNLLGVGVPYAGQ